VIAQRSGVALLEVDVSHRVRRGGSSEGTTWKRGVSPIPMRLVRFSLGALRESWALRDSLRSIPARRLGAAGSPLGSGRR
jgi:hypothetical protein